MFARVSIAITTIDAGRESRVDLFEQKIGGRELGRHKRYIQELIRRIGQRARIQIRQRVGEILRDITMLIAIVVIVHRVKKAVRGHASRAAYRIRVGVSVRRRGVGWRVGRL